MRQTAAREPDRPAIGHKTWQAENPDVLLGRTRPTSACVCSSPSGLPTNCGAPFSTLPESLTSFSVLTCLHSIAIFSLYTIPAVCFSIFSLNHIFFCLSHCTQYKHCVSQKKSLNPIFFGLSDHGTFSRAKFPDPDDDGFKLFTSLVHCASHSTSSSTQIQERLERWFYSIVDGFV